MKTTLLFLGLLLSCWLAQAQTFLFTDTVFSKGATHRLPSFTWSGHWISIGEQERKPIYDSIVDFMARNPLIELELSFHMDSRPSKTYSLSLTGKRAEIIKRELARAGADTTRITTAGYGATQPINVDEYIETLNSEMEKEEAHQWNRREVLTITKTKKND
jgi:hypothetical protein